MIVGYVRIKLVGIGGSTTGFKADELFISYHNISNPLHRAEDHLQYSLLAKTHNNSIIRFFGGSIGATMVAKCIFRFTTISETGRHFSTSTST